MAEQKKEIAKTFSETLTDKLISVESALPKDFNITRFTQNALALINDNPQLQKINKAQLIQGLLKCSYMGLDVMNKEAYLIPYGQSLQVQVSYTGMAKFCKKYAIRPIQDIASYIVREGDVFESGIKDNKAYINFTPKPFNTGEIVGCFAVVYYKDNSIDFETMTTEEINQVRTSYSKQANGSTWKNSWSEMARKTVLRRLMKHIETDFESTEMKQAWDETSDSEFTVKREVNNEVVDVFSSAKPVDVIDTTASEVTDDDLNREVEEVFGK
jgi:recombination protein RecT